MAINVNPFHRAEVDHHAAIDRGAARDVVAAAANSHFQADAASEVDGINDVGHAATSGDQCGALVDEAVVDLAGFLVAGIGRLQELSAERGRELGCSMVNGMRSTTWRAPR